MRWEPAALAETVIMTLTLRSLIVTEFVNCSSITKSNTLCKYSSFEREQQQVNYIAVKAYTETTQVQKEEAGPPNCLSK